MANLALYRKYRPQKFDEVIGQEHIITTIRNALVSDMLSHAYIFSGLRGSGKTTTARLLAAMAGRKGNQSPAENALHAKK